MYEIIIKAVKPLDLGSLSGEYVAHISYFFRREPDKKHSLGQPLLDPDEKIYLKKSTLWTARFPIHIKNISDHITMAITDRMKFLKLPKEIRIKILTLVREKLQVQMDCLRTPGSSH